MAKLDTNKDRILEAARRHGVDLHKRLPHGMAQVIAAEVGVSRSYASVTLSKLRMELKAGEGQPVHLTGNIAKRVQAAVDARGIDLSRPVSRKTVREVAESCRLTETSVVSQFQRLRRSSGVILSLDFPLPLDLKLGLQKLSERTGIKIPDLVVLAIREALGKSDVKQCGRCRAALPLDHYHRERGRSDGRAAICKACQREKDARRAETKSA